MRHKKNTFKDDWIDNARDLNAFSWWCFEHQINLEEAKKLAKRGVALAEPGPQKTSILNTLAEILFLQGDKEEAITLINEAIKENPEREYFKEQLTRFEKAVAAVNKQGN